MNLTVLLDLDDTLLSNDMDRFLPAYLHRLGQASPSIPADLLIKNVLASTQKMAENRNPSMFLQDVFDLYFYPEIGLEKNQINDVFNEFYTKEYGKLQSLTSQRIEAVDLVFNLINQGCRVIIATNPLFPHIAITQRLDWAGLSALKNSLHLITTFESFHFSKPHQAYYAEILAQLGWPDVPVAMVGNSLEDDILPAESIGIPCFWLHNKPEGSLKLKNPLSTAGELKDIIPWLEKVASLPSYQPTINKTNADAFLRSTPAAIHTFLCTPLQPLSKLEKKMVQTAISLEEADRTTHLPNLLQILGIGASESTTPKKQVGNQFSSSGFGASIRFSESRTELMNLLFNLTQPQWEAVEKTVQKIIQEDRKILHESRLFI